MTFVAFLHGVLFGTFAGGLLELGNQYIPHWEKIVVVALLAFSAAIWAIDGATAQAVNNSAYHLGVFSGAFVGTSLVTRIWEHPG